MSKNKYCFLRKILAVFLSAALIVGMNPIRVRAAEDLVTVTFRVPILGYYEDEPPAGIKVGISTAYKENKNNTHLGMNPNNGVDTLGVTTEWNNEEKAFTYNFTVDRSVDGYMHTYIILPDGPTSYGTHGISIPADEDTFTYTNAWSYPWDPYSGAMVLNIRLMLDKGTLYENYITQHRNRGFQRTVENPTREGYEFLYWKMPSGSPFDADPTDGTLTSEPMTLYAVWRNADGDELDSPEPPTASRDSGNYDESFDVELTADSGCDIYYTTDGSKPTKDSTKYSGAITVDGEPGEDTTTKIRAIAVKDGMSSEIATYEYTLHIPAPHVHDWSQTWDNDTVAHWHECTNPDCPITENSDKDGYAAHTEDNGTVTTEPTVDTEGVRTYKCSECGYVMRTEVIDKLTTAATPTPTPMPTPTPAPTPTPVPSATSTPDPSHTHSYGREWKTDDDNHWHECACGDKSDIGAHTEDNGTVTKEPTVDSEGTKVYKCSVCGYIMRTDILEKLDPEQAENGTDNTDDDDDDDDSSGSRKTTGKSGGSGNTPETGDTSHVEIHATVAMIAGLSYLLLYFLNDEHGMTEEKKKELISRLIGWARKGSCVRRYAAVILICLLLVYYHGIGKRMTVEWKQLYD